MSTAKHRVLIVDDHPMIREGTARIFNLQPDLVLCGAAATAAEALDGIPQAKPDVLVVDLSLEGRSGLELIKCLRQHYPKLPVIVYTMHEESLYAARAAEAGACGYVTKRQPSSELLQAVRAAVRGPTALTAAPPVPTARLPLGTLSDRELEVYQLRGQGLSGDQIADRLHLSRKTVDSHLQHIKQKLGLPNAAALLRSAVEWMQQQRGG